jgi:hypothetical protein
MFDPSTFKDTYSTEKQAGGNGSFELPEPGEYAVAVSRLQRMCVGARGTPKVRFRAVILGAEDERLRSYVGKSFPFDLWWNLEKDGNARRLAYLCAACGVVSPFDPNDDHELAKATTGVPFKIKIEIEEKEFGGRVRKDVRVLWTTHLAKPRREKLASDPGFAKVMGRLEDRVLEAKDYTSGGAGGGYPSAPRTRDPEPQNGDEIADEDPFGLPF